MTAIVFALLIASQPQPLISQQVCPVPTGHNGYEEYLYACDIVNSQEYQSFVQWERYWDANKRGAPWTGPIPPTPRGLNLESSLLEERRVKAKTFVKVLELVRAGNQKPVLHPWPTISIDQRNPEYRSLMEIASFCAISAYTNFADGKSNVGTEELLTGLTFATNIATGPSIAQLNSQDSRGMLFGIAGTLLRCLSERDCDLVIRTVSSELKRPTPILQCLKFQRDFAFAMISWAIDNPRKSLFATDFGDDTPERLRFENAVANLSGADSDGLKQVVKSQLDSYFSKLIDSASGSESKWNSAELPPSKVDPKTISIWKPDTLAAKLVEGWLSTSQRMMVYELRHRTQWKLLLLHARVMKHRWQHGELPKLLSHAAPVDELADLIYGGSFKYELLPRNDYRIYSTGTTSGTIEILPGPPSGSNVIPRSGTKPP